MKRKLIIFGAGDIAQLAHYYFTHDSECEVVAFTVDQSYLSKDSFCDLPVVPFEKVELLFSPEQYYCFVAVSYSRLNLVRKNKYFECINKGYRFVSYISSRANILTNDVIGENCFILEDNTIQPFAKIGNNVTLWSGNHLGHHSIIKDHTFIASHVVISGGVEIGEQCFIGVNATIRDHIKIGDRCVVGAGSLLLSDAEPDGVYAEKGTPRSIVHSSRLRNI